MMNYSNGFRARMVQRMAGPEGLSAFKLAEEIGVHQSTLSRWLRETSREENRERRGKVRRKGRRFWGGKLHGDTYCN